MSLHVPVYSIHQQDAVSTNVCHSLFVGRIRSSAVVSQISIWPKITNSSTPVNPLVIFHHHERSQLNKASARKPRKIGKFGQIENTQHGEEDKLSIIDLGRIGKPTTPLQRRMVNGFEWNVVAVTERPSLSRTTRGAPRQSTRRRMCIHVYVYFIGVYCSVFDTDTTIYYEMLCLKIYIPNDPDPRDMSVRLN